MDKKFMVLMIVFFMVFGVFITSTLFGGQLSKFTRAAVESQPSSQNSLIYAWPLDVTLAERKTSEINIFVRNGDSAPLANQNVKLETDFGTLDQSDKTTDKTGKVTFILTSEGEGVANLSATINNSIPLSQKISVKFK